MNDELLNVKNILGKKDLSGIFGCDDTGFKFITSPMNVINQPLNRYFREWGGSLRLLLVLGS